MNAFANIDLTTASLEELDNLSIEMLLGQQLSEVDFANLLPTGTYILEMDMEKSIADSLERKAADPEKDKKASVQLPMRFRVVKVLACADADVDTDALVGRFHTERYMLTMDFGKKNLAMLIIGILGISPKDKAALAEVGKEMWSILEELRQLKVAFACKIKQEERKGFDNANIVAKFNDFVSAQRVVELLD